MDELDKRLSGTRKELIIQLVFTLFAVVIRDQLLQLILLGIGFLVVSLLIWARSAKSAGAHQLLGQLLRYVVIQGAGYFLVLFGWIWGAEFMNVLFDLRNGFLAGILILICLAILLVFTMLALTRPTLVFGGEFEYPILELFWIVGLVISLNLPDTGYTAGIQLAVVAGLIVALFSRSGALAIVINVVAGLVFGYIYLSFGGQTHATLELIPFIAGIIAAITSTMIKGLAILVLREI